MAIARQHTYIQRWSYSTQKNTKQIYNIHTCEQFFLWLLLYVHHIKSTYLSNKVQSMNMKITLHLHYIYYTRQHNHEESPLLILRIYVYILAFTYNMQKKHVVYVQISVYSVYGIHTIQIPYIHLFVMPVHVEFYGLQTLIM